jgi:hypothetical protein
MKSGRRRFPSLFPLSYTPSQSAMAPTLVLDIQLHILKLATPPQTVSKQAERRDFLRTCSLVHHSWLGTAQRLLFRHLRIDFDTLRSDASAVDALFDLAERKTPFVDSVELDCDEGGWDESALEAVWRRCLKVKELTVRWKEGEPCAVLDLLEGA